MNVAELAAEKGITRLCHYTPLSNLLHLAAEDRGLLSLKQLAATASEHDRQDLLRLDGHHDHISCSIEYPNAWYLRRRLFQATAIQRLFPDWVCLMLAPQSLWQPGTRVCVRNAAAANGSMIRDVSPTALRRSTRRP
ncbi:hypothetical protein [Conexibacter sp. CPCC 206217]|uniref:hypothetical protein n=1 Tax=Conexibacter sp. CPCC 206217 TaxID=3064574 RepID=UPI00271A5F8F|nr:hypothetical protein [Conexibacter sp. CPCC 206217]MDO8211009.1 hypothetical protein [Conexibacter sp. CPCC 206217]